MERKKRIARLEEEILAVEKSREEYLKKTAERLKLLKKKAEEEKRLSKAEDDEMIADAVRSVYGEVTEENLSLFLMQMKRMMPTQEGQVDEG